MRRQFWPLGRAVEMDRGRPGETESGGECIGFLCPARDGISVANSNETEHVGREHWGENWVEMV